MVPLGRKGRYGKMLRCSRAMRRGITVQLDCTAGRDEKACFKFAAGGLCLALCLLTSLGCRQGPPLTTFSGEVTLDGAPVGPLSIVFHPLETTNQGTSLVAADGTFEAKDHQALFPGRYEVTIEELQPDLEEYEIRRSQQNFGLVDFKIPDKYRKRGWTSVEVQPDQANHFLFELHSK